MKSCPNCGRTLSNGNARFCPYCGADVDSQAIKPPTSASSPSLLPYPSTAPSAYFELHQEKGINRQASKRGSSFLQRVLGLFRKTPLKHVSYVHQVNLWAEAYDQEKIVKSPVELEALYDDAFFEAVELEKKIP